MIAGGNQRPSLILATIDCLRADHTGFLGYPEPTTPFLDSLARKSLVLSNAIVAGAPTYYSFPAIFASRYPLALGRDVLGLAPGEPCLASVLAQAGYRTAAFNAGNVYLCSRFGYEQGFELFCDFLEHEVAQSEGSQPARDSQLAWYSRLNRGLQRASRRLRPLDAVYDELYFQYCQWLASRSAESMDGLRRVPPANVLVDQALTWVQSVAGQPFFLWLHFMDAHHPYHPPDEALAALGHVDIDTRRARYLNSFWDRGDLDARRLARHLPQVIALYDAGIRWVDTQLSRLAAGLVGLNLWPETAFVVTADHGEEFLDHGGRYHSPPQLTDELLRVPLLLRLPGVDQGSVMESPFSLLHLAPTLLDVLGTAAPEEFAGCSQWETLRGGRSASAPVVTEVVDGCTNPFHPCDRIGARLLAVRDARYKMVIRFAEDREELFDLQADPREQNPLAPGAEPGVRRRFLEIARQHLQQSPRMDSLAHLRARLQDLRHSSKLGVGEESYGQMPTGT